MFGPPSAVFQEQQSHLQKVFDYQSRWGTCVEGWMI